MIKVGILIAGANTENVYEKFKWAKDLGFDNCQLSIWDMSLHTDEFANAVKRAMAELDFKVTAVWCGWSGPVDWSYPNMYLTLGLVPAAYRCRRVKDIFGGAELARKLGVKDIITHMGFLPDDPNHEDRFGAMVAVTDYGRALASLRTLLIRASLVSRFTQSSDMRAAVFVPAAETTTNGSGTRTSQAAQPLTITFTTLTLSVGCSVFPML